MNNNWKDKLKERTKKFFWHGYWTDPIIFFSAVLAVFVNIGIWMSLFLIMPKTDQPIILHYNIYFGVDAIGSGKTAYLMPALALVMFIINLILSRFFYYKEKFVSYLFAAMGLLVQFLMVVGAGSILLINF
jgi:hypothetical protein